MAPVLQVPAKVGVLAGAHSAAAEEAINLLPLSARVGGGELAADFGDE